MKLKLGDLSSRVFQGSSNILNRVKAVENKATDLGAAEAGVQTGDQITSMPGDQVGGRFISPDATSVDSNGNQVSEPTNAAFTGSFQSGPGETFGGILYQFGAVLRGVLGAGFNNKGQLLAAGGNWVLSKLGIVSQNLPMWFLDRTGGYLRGIGYIYIGSEDPAHYGLFSVEYGSSSFGNQIANGDFETGDFTGWTQTGTPTISTPGADDNYCALVDASNYITQALAHGTTTIGTQYLIILKYNNGTGLPNITLTNTDVSVLGVYVTSAATWSYLVIVATQVLASAPSLTIKGQGGNCYIDVVEVYQTTGFSYLGSRTDSSFTLDLIASNNIFFTSSSEVAVFAPFLLNTVYRGSQTTTPAVPASSSDNLYFKSDDRLYIQNHAGTETSLATGSGSANGVNTGDQRVRELLTTSRTYYVGYDLGTVTMTIASPCVVSKTAHGLSIGDPVVFRTTGALPTGITAGTVYYIISAGFGANSFEISTAPGGSAVNTSGTQSGTHSFQTGNDANAGLTTGRAGAFLTVQAAVDTIANNLDIAGNAVTVQIADGLYTGNVTLKNVVGYAAPGNLVIQGDNSTPANVLINTTGVCFTASKISTIWDVKDLKLTATTTGLYVEDAVLRFGNLDFGACNAKHIWANLRGHISCLSSYVISGNAVQHYECGAGGLIDLSSPTVTILANITVTTFAEAVTGSLISALSVTYSLGAFTVTGKKYNSTNNSNINSFGGGANYFPGSVAGTTATGGNYL